MSCWPRTPTPGCGASIPTAYAEDVELDEEYQRLVHDDLLARRLAAFEIVEDDLDAERVDEEQLAAWMGASTTCVWSSGRSSTSREDPYFDIDEADPDAQAHAIYTYLGWLLEQIVSELNP